MPAPAPSSRPNWQKLGVKPGDVLHVADAPPDFARATLAGDAHVVRDGLPGAPLARTDVALAFADSRAAVAALAERLRPLLGAGVDVRVWIAYPKGGRADFNRDSGWEPIGAVGLEGVSQVALDPTWSALRFRHRDFTTRRAGRTDG